MEGFAIAIHLYMQDLCCVTEFEELRSLYKPFCLKFSLCPASQNLIDTCIVVNKANIKTF